MVSCARPPVHARPPRRPALPCPLARQPTPRVAPVRRVNVWKPIEHPVVGNHLCLIDSRTVQEADLVEYVYDGGTTRGGVALMPVYRERHRWQYYPGMRTDEVLIFKQEDTRRSGPAATRSRRQERRSRWTPHTSFYDRPRESTTRSSIELRVACVFPKAARAPSRL